MQDWKEGELSMHSDVEQQGGDETGEARKASSEDATLDTIRINVAATLQQQTGKIGVCWSFKRDDGR